MLISFMIRFESDWFYYIEFRYFLYLNLIAITYLLFSNIYKSMWKYASMAELYSIIKITALINTSYIILYFFFNISFPRSIVVINSMTDLMLLGGSRFTLRMLRDNLVRKKADNHNARVRALIIGAGDAGEIIVRELNRHPEIGISVVGLIDDDPAKQHLEIHGHKVLGTREDIPKYIKSFDVHEVIIAIPSADGPTIKELYKLSCKKGVRVKIVPGVYEILNGDVNLSQIREVKVEDLLRRDPVDLKTEEISEYLRDRTVLVTGGGGSIGSEICRQVANFNPAEIIILDINENSTYFLELEMENKFPHLKITPIIGSIRDKAKLEQVFSEYQPEVVFHAAAHKHVPLMESSPEEAVKNNILGSKKLAETADQYQVKSFVLVSTDKAVNPTNVMGASKRAAEMIIQSMSEKSRTKFMAVRFGNVLGSKGSVIPIFKRQIAVGGPVTVTHEEITRYFMTIPEAAQLVIQAGALGQGGEVFVLDMGEPVRIRELAEDLITLSGLTPYKDIDIEIVGLRPGEKLYEELLLETEESTATQHERIFINHLGLVEEDKLHSVLKRLEFLAKKKDERGIISNLGKLVASYEPRRDNVTRVDFRKKKNA
ncbi:MAG: polysaccharide biosynthesis protein [Halanaerobium sp.]